MSMCFIVSGLAASDLFHAYPSLYPLLLRHLDKSTKLSSNELSQLSKDSSFTSTVVHPSLYPTLLILSVPHLLFSSFVTLRDFCIVEFIFFILIILPEIVANAT